jgi:hypothetical protein
MAQDKNRIQVNDYANPIINSRIKYIDENDKKIKGRKGFLFGSFVNERERIVCIFPFLNIIISYRKKQLRIIVG